MPMEKKGAKEFSWKIEKSEVIKAFSEKFRDYENMENL